MDVGMLLYISCTLLEPCSLGMAMFGHTLIHSCYPFPPSPFQFTRCVCFTQSHPNLFEWTVGWIKPWVTFALDVSRCSPKLSRPSSSFIQSPIIVHHLYRLIQNQIKPQKIKIKNRKTENKLELYGFLWVALVQMCDAQTWTGLLIGDEKQFLCNSHIFQLILIIK